MRKVMILAMALISISAMGQEKEISERTELSVEQRATLQTKRMTLALDLSESQQNEVQALHIEQAKLRKEKKASKATKGSQKLTSEEKYAMQNAKLDRQIAHKAKIKKILSTEQYERWEKMVVRKGKRKRGRKEKKGEGKQRRNKQ